MLRVGDIVGLKVYKNKKGRKGKVKQAKLGKVHMAVFSPDGRSVVGFTVKRPDVAGMVKRPDSFMARDAFGTIENGLIITNEKDGLDDAARERLHIDWDGCIMWTGMDAKTTDGRELGYVSDARFDPKTGAVECFCVGDGGVAESLVGTLDIPASMMRGYSKGYMIVAPEAADLKLSGGAAAAAGEGYAKAKVAGKAAAKKAGAVASGAVDKGSFALGKALGKAKRAVKEAQAQDEGSQGEKALEDEGREQLPASEAADVSVSEPQIAGELHRGEAERASAGAKPKTYVPAGKAAKKPAAKAPAVKPVAKKRPVTKSDREAQGQKAARAVGKEIGKMGNMFGSFMDEYKKASK